jgi:hypothetical protein
MDWRRFSLLQLMKPVFIHPPSTYIELGGIFWVLLLFRDLKVAGMTKSQWVTMLASITAGMVVVRPSTALVLHGCGETLFSNHRMRGVLKMCGPLWVDEVYIELATR